MINSNTLKQNIIKELGLEALADDKKAALLQQMAEIIQQKLTLRLMDKMTPEDKETFEKTMDTDPDKANEFIQKTFPDFLEIMQEEIIKLKQELITHLQKNNTL